MLKTVFCKEISYFLLSSWSIWTASHVDKNTKEIENSFDTTAPSNNYMKCQNLEMSKRTNVTRACNFIWSDVHFMTRLPVPFQSSHEYFEIWPYKRHKLSCKGSILYKKTSQWQTEKLNIRMASQLYLESRNYKHHQDDLKFQVSWKPHLVSNDIHMTVTRKVQMAMTKHGWLYKVLRK